MRDRNDYGHFNSLAPREANPFLYEPDGIFTTFQLTRPTRGEPSEFFLNCFHFGISTHSPHARRTAIGFHIAQTLPYFNSLAPREANRAASSSAVLIQSFQLTRPTRGEPGKLCRQCWIRKISTHSPHARRTHILKILLFYMSISTHSPHARRTSPRHPQYRKALNFNSLAPREANPSFVIRLSQRSIFQLTRPTRGEPVQHRVWHTHYRISTHSPHARRTHCSTTRLCRPFHFNSLAPREANPPAKVAQATNEYISTHSPHARRTRQQRETAEEMNNFNSLAPREANLRNEVNDHVLQNFNSLAPREANPRKLFQRPLLFRFQLTRPTRGEPPYLAIGLLAHHYLGRTFTFRLILSSVFFRFFPRTSRDFRVVCGSHDQNMIKPSLSYPAFAPICSTFFFQSFPR